MRDIRNDLRERLESITADRRRLEAKLGDLKRAEDGVKALLSQEEEHFASLSSPLFPEVEATNCTGLAPLILVAMKKKNRPLDLQELKEELAKTSYNFGEKNPGRAIHFALVGLDQNGVVERLEDRRWTIKQDNGIPVQETAH